jgi:hypothetical protein
MTELASRAPARSRASYAVSSNPSETLRDKSYGYKPRTPEVLGPIAVSVSHWLQQMPASVSY